jgi:excinuclease ABC subunit C
LILIDGGLGQLHAAANALEALGILNPAMASLAKREEILYVLGQEDEPVVLDRRSPVLHLVQMIRDEAHRFAVAFHRQSRRARDLESELDAIPGIGPRRRRDLLAAFGSLAGVRRASREQLTPVVGARVADAVLAHFAGR